MKLIAQIKLQPTKEQYQQLKQTLKHANQACDFISQYAWDNKVFGKFKLQKLVYYEVRNKFGLSAQMTVRCLAKVADAYKLNKITNRVFKPTGSIAYDDRILSYKLDKQMVSILSFAGRLKIPFVCGQHQKELLKTRQGESDLALIDNTFYLLTTCNIEEPPLNNISGFLGVDLGIKAIAVDSDGEIFSGSHVNNLRARYTNLGSKLQSKGTQASKRLLKKRNKKESRFAKDTNHIVAKRLVEKAKDTERGIALADLLEDLKGIRKRITVRKAQRRIHHSWAFHNLIQKINYKAVLAGVPVVLIDPAYTSQECSVCGYTDKHNRPDQKTFLCKSCGHSALADINAAVNIGSRAACQPANP